VALSGKFLANLAAALTAIPDHLERDDDHAVRSATAG
jgi:hypothetical protein